MDDAECRCLPSPIAYIETTHILGMTQSDSRQERFIMSKFTVSVISQGDLVGWTIIRGQAVAQVSTAHWQSVPGITYNEGKQSGTVGQAPYCSRSSQRIMIRLSPHSRRYES